MLHFQRKHIYKNTSSLWSVPDKNMPPCAAWRKYFKLKDVVCIEPITHENRNPLPPTLISCLGNAPCERGELHEAQDFHLPIIVLKTATSTCSTQMGWKSISNPVPHLPSVSPYALWWRHWCGRQILCSGHEIYRSPGLRVHIPGMWSFSSTNTALETIATHHPDWCQSVSASNTNAFLGTPLKWKRQFTVAFVKVLLVMKYWVSITF